MYSLLPKCPVLLILQVLRNVYYRSVTFFLTGMDDDSLCYSVLLKYQACKSCITFTLLSLCKQLFGNNTYSDVNLICYNYS